MRVAIAGAGAGAAIPEPVPPATWTAMGSVVVRTILLAAGSK